MERENALFAVLLKLDQRFMLSHIFVKDATASSWLKHKDWKRVEKNPPTNQGMGSL